MSFEAIKKVTDAEEAVRERKADAAAEAKRITAEADRAGRQLVAEARAKAEEQVKAMLAEAEARAEVKAGEARTENAAACDALKQSARDRLDRAADLIVERVGNS